MNHLAVTWKVDDKLYQHIGESRPYWIVYLCLMFLPYSDPRRRRAERGPDRAKRRGTASR